jgi:hypothetical protein
MVNETANLPLQTILELGKKLNLMEERMSSLLSSVNFLMELELNRQKEFEKFKEDVAEIILQITQ